MVKAWVQSARMIHHAKTTNSSANSVTSSDLQLSYLTRRILVAAPANYRLPRVVRQICATLGIAATVRCWGDNSPLSRRAACNTRR